MILINSYKKCKLNWLKTVKDITGCFRKENCRSISLVDRNVTILESTVFVFWNKEANIIQFYLLTCFFNDMVWFTSLKKKVILKIKFLCTGCRFFLSIVSSLFLPLFNILIKLEHSYRTFHLTIVINLPLYIVLYYFIYISVIL